MGKQYLNGVLYGTGEIIKFSPYIYSLDEREVGVWTDGKPLYEKSFIIPISSQSGDITHTVDSNINVVNALGIIKTSGGFEMALPASYSNIFLCGLQHDSTYIRLSIYSASDWQRYNTLTEAVVTIQYTKTTDTPGSGHYTTNGGEAHHYSLTEQVIGTWIDNKPLYERVFVFENSLSVQSSWTLTNIDSTNIQDVVNVIGIHEDGTCYNILCADPTQSNHTKIGLMAYSATSITQIIKVILQYTKTTD